MNFARALIPVLPLAVVFAGRWVREQEAQICQDGVALTKSQLDDAREAGVAHPEKIRLGFVDEIPMPGGLLLGRLGKFTGLVSASTAGITLNYGIYIRNRYRRDRGLLVHECVHVGQYERYGSIEKFLSAYLRECLDPGYPWGVLEQEAIYGADRIMSKN